MQNICKKILLLVTCSKFNETIASIFNNFISAVVFSLMFLFFPPRFLIRSPPKSRVCVSVYVYILVVVC